MKILVLNGPNLNMLGKRNPNMYGGDTLATVQKQIKAYAKSKKVSVVFAQSNCEGKLIDILQKTKCNAVVINAGAYSHYSYALRDCIEDMDIPVVEAHMTDIYKRETFRHTDLLKDVCLAQFYGHGIGSYCDAIDYILNI